MQAKTSPTISVGWTLGWCSIRERRIWIKAPVKMMVLRAKIEVLEKESIMVGLMDVGPNYFVVLYLFSIALEGDDFMYLAYKIVVAA
jgi:hypothetical protein